jgi:hypothetical protein
LRFVLGLVVDAHVLHWRVQLWEGDVGEALADVPVQGFDFGVVHWDVLVEAPRLDGFVTHCVDCLVFH